jgi:6-phosphofructokinase
VGSFKRLGILVGGSAGINAVLSAATIAALNQGLEVFGILEGRTASGAYTAC